MIRVYGIIILYSLFLPVNQLVISILNKINLFTTVCNGLIISFKLLEIFYILKVIKVEQFVFLDTKKVYFNPKIYRSYKIRKKLQVIIELFYYLILLEFALFFSRSTSKYLRYTDFCTILILGIIIPIYNDKQGNIGGENKRKRYFVTIVMICLAMPFLVAEIGLLFSDLPIRIKVADSFIYFTGLSAISAIIVAGILDLYRFDSGLKSVANV